MPRRSEVRRPASRRRFGKLADERLVALVRRGDESAFEELFDRHSGGILSFCSRILSSREEGEDALQHAFLVVHQTIRGRRFEPRAFKPWLYTVARNRCVSVLRARGEAPLAEEGESVAAGEETADLAEQRAEVRDLLGDVQNLPEPQRAALLLSELGDLSHAQIAHVVDCPREKVKSLVFQARASLICGREARETPCSRVREELAGSADSRLPRAMRHHLKRCERCSEFAQEVRRRRRLIAIALPVAPSIGLKRSVLAEASVGQLRGGGGLAAGLAAKGAPIGGSSAGVAGATAGGGLGVALVAKATLVVVAAGVGVIGLAGSGLIELPLPDRDSGHRTSASEDRSGAAEWKRFLAHALVAPADARAAERDQHPDGPSGVLLPDRREQTSPTAFPAALARLGNSIAGSRAGRAGAPDLGLWDRVPHPDLGGRVPDLGVERQVLGLGLWDRVPHPDLGGRVPHPDLGIRVPHPDLGGRVPHPDLGGRVPDLGVEGQVPDLGVEGQVPGLGLGVEQPLAGR
jgi:RNA polymerase sigma factor (sigma-70 family)